MKREKSASLKNQTQNGGQLPDKKVVQPTLQPRYSFETTRYANIRKFTLVVFAALAFAIPFYVVIGLTVNSNAFLLAIPCVLWLICYAFAFFYASPDSEKRINLACYVELGGTLVAMGIFHYLVGSVDGVAVAYACIIVIAAIMGLRRNGVLIVSALSILISAGMVAAERGFKLYTPPMNLEDQPVIRIVLLVLTLTVFATEIVILVHNLYAAMDEAREQAHQYQQANQRLSQTNQFGKQVTTSLNTIVTELNTTSRQQASGAQEQAAAVMEVTTSMTELGETARQIAMNSNRVSVAASDGLYSAQRVREATERANTTAERGQTAVDSSIKAIEDVRNGITGLAERLMTLTERSRQISSIIALIKEIADETHLLALNAAIESAGSGENGRRFAVVASEVKSLADRSLEATTEVSQIISELQGAVAAAVLASEETRKKTFGAVERSYMAGQVITELGQVVDETAMSSVQIVDSVQQVATLAEEIRLATQQQESAIRQIITTMEGVGMVAQENASAVSEVSETVNRIDNLSNQLKDALENAALLLSAA